MLPDFSRDGFVVVPQLLSTGDFAELQTQLARYIREVVPELSDAHAFYEDKSQPNTLKQLQHMDVDPWFKGYVSHPVWKGLAETLLGEPCKAMAPEWFNKPPHNRLPTPPHQDNYYFCLRPPQVVTIWMALDPIDESNGCLRYVPGSHRRGIRPHGRSSILGFSQGIVDYDDDDRRQETPIVLQPGDVVAHHGDLIHRADPNSSPRNRRAFAMVFQGESCRRDEQAFARYQENLKNQHQALGLQS